MNDGADANWDDASNLVPGEAVPHAHQGDDEGELDPSTQADRREEPGDSWTLDELATWIESLTRGDRSVRGDGIAERALLRQEDRWSEGPWGGERFYWGQAGWSYYLVDRQAGSIVALLYWDNEQLGEEGGPDGGPVILDPAWMWLAADDPDMHNDLQAPVPTSMMSYEELRAAHERALGEAQVVILTYLGGKGLL